jgi:hypothetical protein
MNWVEAEVDLALSRAATDKQNPLLFIPVLAAHSAGSSALPPFGAAIGMRVEDVYTQNRRLCVRLHDIGRTFEPGGEPLAAGDACAG